MDRHQKGIVYETRHEEVARDFFRYLHDFSNGGWYGGEYRQQGFSAPHLLREEFHHEDRYFNALFSMAKQLLQNTYKDSGAHQYPCSDMRIIARTNFLRVYDGDEEEKPTSQLSELFPEVKRIISAHGHDVKQAFQTVFDSCRIYQKAVENTLASGGTKHITPEQHGITEEQADRLHDALLKIWKVYPETDTRISEGFDYAMHDPVARKVFTFPEPIGSVSGYVFADSSSRFRSDYRLVEMLGNYDGNKLNRLDEFKNTIVITPKEVSAIAVQSILNLEKLEAFSVPIAERALTKFIDTVCKDGYADKTAKQIFENLASRKTTIKEEADKIRKREYGDLKGGYTGWLQKDNDRLMALAVLSGAEPYLELCVDIHDGEWFRQERNKILTLCAQKNLPGFVSEPVFKRPAPKPF